MRSRLLIGAAAGLAISMTAAAQTLVVGNKEANTVGFVDLAVGEMVRTLETGRGPHEVAISPDGATAAVVAYGTGPAPGHTLELFDLAAATSLKTIDLTPHTRPHGIAWLPDGRHLVVTTEGSGQLAIVDTDAGEVSDTVATGERGSHLLALGPAAERVYVSNLGSASFTVIDLDSRRRLATIPAGEGSEGIAVTPDGSEIWVTNRAADTVMVFDAESYARKALIEAGQMPIRVAISPDGAVAAVSNARASSLTVIDTQSKEVLRTVELTPSGGWQGAPVTLLFDPDGSRLFVALTRAAEIAVLDISTWRQADLISAGAGSDGLGYSPLSLTQGR